MNRILAIQIIAVCVVVFVVVITQHLVHIETLSRQRVKNATFFEMSSQSRSDYAYMYVTNFSIVSVCIPAIASDMTIFLPRLLNSIQNQTHVPLEVIVVMSNVKSSECTKFDEQLQSILKSSKLRLYCTPKLQYQSLSRQNASALAQGIIVSFIDADDFMYPNRLEVIVNMFRKYKPFMVLHGFSKNMEPPPTNKWKEAQIMDGIKLYDIASKTVSYQPSLLYEIMHSQVSVLRYVCTVISFRTDKQFYKSEDAWYIRDIISYFGRQTSTCVFINTPLAWYVPREFQIG